MHFLISCGGTGGHLSPGISLAEGLIARGHTATLLISRKRVDTRLSEKYPALTFMRMPGRPFSWGPIRLLRCLVSQFGAVLFCIRLIARQTPDAVIGFGGFTSAPIVLAGRLGGVPVALHEANRVPGRATRTLGRFATRVYLPPGIRISSVGAKATRQLGLPVRREIVRLPRAEARAALGLEAGQRSWPFSAAAKGRPVSTPGPGRR
jgi:UDP-N-acetylglucosamine--N-acetylmuramyl-(pentapeptide) pyrophosphoryl-undecaprenol N-acetylglucosamine transferase